MLKSKFIFPIFILFLLTSCNTSVPAQPNPTSVVIAEPTFPPTESVIPLTEAEVPRVSLEDAYAAYNADTAIFVDVRSKQAYEAGHIPGALSIQLGEFETNPTKLKLPKDEWIITYCT